MEKENNKGLWAAVGILMILVLLLAVSVAILLFGRSREGREENRNAGPYVNEDKKTTAQKDIIDKDLPDVFDKEVETADVKKDSGVTMVIDGFQFHVPADYDCFYAYDIGPVVYLDGIFQMKTAVRDGSYEDSMKNPSALTEKTVEAGGKILQDIKETELDGKKYAYFLMELAGDKCFVGYTQAADTDKRLGGQIVIESEHLTDEDLLHIFANVAATAQVTDKPDSTYDDIVAQVVGQSVSPGERKEESKLYADGVCVTFCVPKYFYSQGGDDEEAPDTECFLSEDLAVSADCLLGTADEFVENARAAVEIEYDFLNDSVKDGAEIQTVQINGNTCYYYLVRYHYNDADYQKLYAACDVGENAYFAVSASVIDEDIELSLDTVREFFVFP